MSEYCSHSLSELGARLLPPALNAIVAPFSKTYIEAALSNHYPREEAEEKLKKLILYVAQEIKQPTHFEPYHKRERSPVDYYDFGLDFFRPVVDWNQSSLRGLPHLEKILKQLSAKENVILLANHQTEPDPQLISLLLENQAPSLAEEMIIVAGQRVVTDPLAIPFSRGRNLLCIYSKKYIESPLEQKAGKLLHNQRTIRRMRQLLDEGGVCIYVAPSGGRDRMSPDGFPVVAPFDPASVEMFLLLGQKSARPTHFYPLALATYNVLPPPDTTQLPIGEKRQTKRTPIHLSFCEEIDFKALESSLPSDKADQRLKKAEIFCRRVILAYQQLI